MANFLTFTRILLTLPLVVAILQEKLELALTITILGALTDLLDGKIARLSGEVTNLGKILDPLADKIFILSALIALVGVGRVGSLPVILLFLREISVSFMRSVAAGQGLIIEASLLGKLKTSLEFLTLLILLYGNPYGTLLLWASVILAYLSAYEYLRTYLRALSELNYP